MKKEEILPCLLAFIMIAYIGYLLYGRVLKMNFLDENIEYTNAVIVDFSSGVRGRP